MDMEIKIRDAKINDSSYIVDFQMAMALETEDLILERSTLSKGVTAVLEDPSKARYFIAEGDGEPVGMLMITTEWSDWRNRWVWWIQSVYTSPECRKMGIYKLLYEHVKEVVSNADNIGGIRLYVDKRNTRAQAVYENLGMNGDHYATFEWMKE
jgi:ribosomal protein S18 acetylase RimI-like enzyme